MTLLLQLDGEIPESPHQRIFYVFACVQTQCRRKPGGVRAIRGVGLRKGALAKAEEEQKKAQEQKVREIEEAQKKKDEVARAGSILFGSESGLGIGGNANPFSMGGSAGANPFGNPCGNPFSTGNSAIENPTATIPPPSTSTSDLSMNFASALKLNLQPPAAKDSDPEPLFYGPPEPWPNPLPQPPFPIYFLDADYEQLDSTPESLLQSATQNVRTDAASLVDSSSSSGGDDWGGYEKSNLDTTFQKFADRVAENPEQVLRYEHKGVPLLYSKADVVGKLLSPLNAVQEPLKNVPRCPGCGKQRFYEFQLMPHAIAMLEADDVGLDGMEWGTIIVASCVCLPKRIDENRVGYVEEWVGVQWEQQKK